MKSYLFVPHARPNGAVQPILFLGWTICYEMYFYAVFAVALMIARQHAAWLCCLLIAAIVAAGAGWRTGGVVWTFYTNPIALEFVYGILVYKLFAKGLLPRSRTTATIAILLAILSGAAIFIGDVRSVLLTTPVPAVLLLVGFVTARSGPVSGLSARLSRLGDASYSLYLAHPYVIQVPVKLLAMRAGFVMLSVSTWMSTIVAVWVSTLLYRRLELPAQRTLLKAFAVPR